MTPGEWESLCDGCGRCCLHKGLDVDGVLLHTRVACRMLDIETCACTAYEARRVHVPNCIDLRTQQDAFEVLPHSCAYRRVHEGRGLAWWHPLVSGDAQTVIFAGVSARHLNLIPEGEIDEEDYDLVAIDLLELPGAEDLD